MTSRGAAGTRTGSRRATPNSTRCAARPAPRLVIPIAGGIGFAVGSGQTPLFTIFGSFALLISRTSPATGRPAPSPTRGLGVNGAVLITLGTLVAPIPWLAVTTMFVLGVAVTFAGVLSSAIAAAQRATLLPFVLPACTPPGPIPERLLGWCIALAVCVPAALFVLPPRHHDDLRRHAARVCAVLAHRLEGHAGAKDVNTAMNALLRQLREQRLPPRRPDGGQPRAGARGRRPRAGCATGCATTPPPPWAMMTDPAVRVLRASARLLRWPASPIAPPDRAELDDGAGRAAFGGAGPLPRGHRRDCSREADDTAADRGGPRLLNRRTSRPRSARPVG